jgi:serine protease inhibitor
VSDKTKGQIKDIVQPRSVRPDTRLVLVNAVHFKGAWAEPFLPHETTNQPFYLADGRKTEVPLMHLEEAFRYAEDANLQIIGLRYQFTDLSMLVLLPRKDTGLSDLEGKLTPGNLSKWLSQMKELEVNLFLPKFKLQSSFELAANLAAMGMPDAFQTSADFSGIDGTRNLYISSVFHKASGEINEEGTEASAGTTVYVVTMSAHMEPPSPPPVFRADHPFIVLIRDRKSGSIVFLGRLLDPTK